MRGASTAINCFLPTAKNYYRNAWQLLKGIGVNTIRVWGGVESDITGLQMHGPYANPNWAQHLEAFLSEATSHGIKVYFDTLGSSWYTLFNIVSPPGGAGPAPATPIDEAKPLIDQLAGDNALGHDFITDPRVIGWCTANEVDISNPEVLDWNIQMLDYIRGKGGKAWIRNPWASVAGPYWKSCDFHVTEPLLRGHVDFLELHEYECEDWKIYHGYPSYEQYYNYWVGLLQKYMIDGCGKYTIDQLILGEFGIWRGPEVGYDGNTYDWSDQDRETYYKVVFNAAKDVGIKNVCLHDFFSQLTYPWTEYERPNWGIVDIHTKDYYPLVADVIREAYGGPTPTPPIIPIMIGAGLGYAVGREPGAAIGALAGATLGSVSFKYRERLTKMGR